MGLTFFNAQRARQKELENFIKPQSILEEQPTSPDIIGEVGETSIENEIEEIKPKTIKKKRK